MESSNKSTNNKVYSVGKFCEHCEYCDRKLLASLIFICLYWFVKRLVYGNYITVKELFDVNKKLWKIRFLANQCSLYLLLWAFSNFWNLFWGNSNAESNWRILHRLFQFSAFSLLVFLFLNRVYMQETRNIVDDRCT